MQIAARLLAALGLLSALSSPAGAQTASLPPGEILVADYAAGSSGNGLLFRVNPATGARQVLSDFNDAGQGPTTGIYGVTVVDRRTILGVGGLSFGFLFQVDPATGVRTILSDFADASQGPLGALPIGVAVINGETLVADRDAGTSERGALFRVNRGTGARELVSDFGNPAHGPLGDSPHQIARERGGRVLVIDADAGTDDKGALFRIDTDSGLRTMVSDFGDPAQGPLGDNPGGVTQGPGDVLLVTDTTAGAGELGVLFAVNPLTGVRTIVSRFDDSAQGPTGVDPFYTAFGSGGAVLVGDPEGGTDLPGDNQPGGNGALFTVNRVTGARVLLSDFGNSAQGPTGVHPNGIAVVPMVDPGDVLITGFTGSSSGGQLIRVHPTSGLRVSVSDWGNAAQGPTGTRPYDIAIGADGDILVVDSVGGGVFVVDRVSGARTMVSQVGNAAQGPTVTQPLGVELGPTGDILVTAKGGTGNDGTLLAVDPVTGMRTLISDFGNATQGTIGSAPEAVRVRASDLLVVDREAPSPAGGSASRGLLFSVNPVTGMRTILSDFGDPAQGLVGLDPYGMAIEPGGHVLVADDSASPTTSSQSVLFRLDGASGHRTLLSDFGDVNQGPLGGGVSPIEVALTADAGILVLEGGADNQPAQPGLGILFAVDRGTGFRTIISDLSDSAQGGTITSAAGLAVFPAPPAAPAAPVAQDGLLTTAEDTPGTGTLQASDPTGAPLTFSLVSNGAIGTAAITNTTTGAFTYTPAPNASGLDTFTFRATNGTADSNVATVVVTITPVNDAPTAVDGTLGVSAGASAAGVLVAADIENDPLTFSIVGAPTQGTATVTDAATGAYTYTAGAGASGTDTFTFKAADGTADSNIATVVVTITAGNRPPVASDSAITTREDRSTSGTLNASDPDGDRLTHTLVSNGTKGTATITNASTGRFTYVPGANATGSDTFTFMAHDGTAASNVATVSVTITPVNDAPVAVPLSLSTTVNTAVTGQLQAVDVDGDALTFSAGKGRGPRRGTISIAPSGQVTYTPTAGFTGTDSFTFQVSDGASSATATVSVTVSP